MAETTQRDLRIFKLLTLGVTTFDMLRSLLLDVFKIDITRTALEKRLSVLRSGGYIQSKKYKQIEKHGNITLYTLTVKSVSVLTWQGQLIENIRWGLPSDTMSHHELAGTKALHSIIRGAARGLYNFRFIDSSILKQQRKPRSKSEIVDLALKLNFNDGGMRDINLEIDRSTVLAHEMAKRLKSLSDKREIVIVLCRTSLRIDSLIKICRDRFYSDFVLFALQNEFNESAFEKAIFKNLQEEKCIIVLKESGGKDSGS